MYSTNFLCQNEQLEVLILVRGHIKQRGKDAPRMSASLYGMNMRVIFKSQLSFGRWDLLCGGLCIVMGFCDVHTKKNHRIEKKLLTSKQIKDASLQNGHRQF